MMMMIAAAAFNASRSYAVAFDSDQEKNPDFSHFHLNFVLFMTAS